MRFLPLPLLVVTLVIAGCAVSLAETSPSQVYLPPPEVLRLGEGVFTSHAIPVESSNPGAGILRSATIQVTGSWGGEAVEERVDCGQDEGGEPLARGGVVSISVQLVARPQSIRQIGPPTRWVPGSRIRIDGEGRQLEVEGRKCTLTRAFRQRILRDLVRQAGGPELPPCEPGDLRCRQFLPGAVPGAQPNLTR